MIQRLIGALLLALVGIPCHAGMVLVIAVEDGRTLMIDSAGRRELIRLEGIEITDELGARELLRWTILERWAMVERNEKSEGRMWRSPDALYINRELVARGYARATMPGILPAPRLLATYLGTIDPPAMPQKVKPSPRKPKQRAKSRK